MKKNKVLVMSTLIATCVGLIPGCGKSSQEVVGENKESDKLSVVCTTFPQYDWARQIIGDELDRYELTLLLDNGVDLHSYQPTAADIAKIATCDLFVYVGGESDKWVEDALKEAVNDKMQVINLLEILGDQVKEEELVEGMQQTAHHHDHEHEEYHDEEHIEAGAAHEEAHVEEAEVLHEEARAEEAEVLHEEAHAEEAETAHEEAHAEEAETAHEEVHSEANHTDEHEHDHEHGEYDEHVWLSLENAKVFVDEIAESIKSIDSEYKAVYEANSEAYIEAINQLDEQYETLVSQADRKTVLFGDRFPFRYMVDDYDLDYYAAFVGCSAETEASFETITFLSGKVDELNLPAILVIENSDQKIAQTISENTTEKNQEILVMDSIQSISREDLQGDYSYLKAMENNLETLEAALN